jgi:hypothetical protein
MKPLSPPTRCKSRDRQAMLSDLQDLQKKLLMKFSELKTQMAALAARSTEAFAELGTKIAALQTQIDELVAGATDPEVTDEVFNADLATLKTNIDLLADIVPASTPPAAKPGPTGGNPNPNQ